MKEEKTKTTIKLTKILVDKKTGWAIDAKNIENEDLINAIIILSKTLKSEIEK